MYSKRFFSNILKNKLKDLIPEKQNEMKELLKNHGKKVIQEVKLEQIVGGMRGIHALYSDVSKLDAIEGIEIRGKTINNICDEFQNAKNGSEPLPEAVLWLLMTGEKPNKLEFEDIKNSLKERETLKSEDIRFIDSLDKKLHPMTQLSMSILNQQKYSIFSQKYTEGVHKKHYWEYFYEDSMDLIAKIPLIAARIYRNKYFNSEHIESDKDLDWAGNYSKMMGYDSHEMKECIRGYLSIHSDHEAGNVSAHATHLVGSALADPYISYSCGINGLAGPLHGLANQEVLKWLIDLRKKLGDKPSHDDIREFVQNTLKSGKVIPGYGHAVLRNTDPRYLHQKAFAQKYIKDDPLVNLVSLCYEVIPDILKATGKVKNPYPNVDCHSGVLLNHYGLKQFEYYTVVFAVSRALGCMSNLVWSRSLGLPIERPDSVDLKWIYNHCN